MDMQDMIIKSQISSKRFWKRENEMKWEQMTRSGRKEVKKVLFSQYQNRFM